MVAGALEDSMESFFLAETAKYLYLLFHNSTAINDFFMLTTEGHLFPILPNNLAPHDGTHQPAPSYCPSQPPPARATQDPTGASTQEVCSVHDAVDVDPSQGVAWARASEATKIFCKLPCAPLSSAQLVTSVRPFNTPITSNANVASVRSSVCLGVNRAVQC
jgi:hypothetical protein